MSGSHNLGLDLSWCPPCHLLSAGPNTWSVPTIMHVCHYLPHHQESGDEHGVRGAVNTQDEAFWAPTVLWSKKVAYRDRRQTWERKKEELSYLGNMSPKGKTGRRRDIMTTWAPDGAKNQEKHRENLSRCCIASPAAQVCLVWPAVSLLLELRMNILCESLCNVFR